MNSSLENIMNLVTEFSQIEFQNGNQAAFDAFDLVLENRSCHFRSQSWFGSKLTERLPEIIDRKCLSFAGSQCNFTFKTHKVVSAKRIEFDQSPKGCAIESFNLTLMRGETEYESVKRLNEPMDDSELRYSYEIQNLPFDRIRINAQTGSEYMCLCGISIKN